MMYAEHNMAFLCDIILLMASTNVLCVYGIIQIQQNMYHHIAFWHSYFTSSILAGALPRALLGKLTTFRQTPYVVGLKERGVSPAPFATSSTLWRRRYARVSRMSRSENFLNEALFGAVRGRSTTHALTSMLHLWSEALDRGDSVRVFLLIIQKHLTAWITQYCLIN